MNVVDSSGWLEYYSNGANAAFFTPPIEDVAQLLVPAVCVFEVYKGVLGQSGEGNALRAVVQMRLARVIDLNTPLAMLAARVSLELKLPLADSVILATARAHGAVLWTQDRDLKGVDGVKYVAKK